MSKKPILLIALAAVATLLMAAILLPPLPAAKKKATRIQAVNSISHISFTLTNGITAKPLPVSKP